LTSFCRVGRKTSGADKERSRSGERERRGEREETKGKKKSRESGLTWEKGGQPR
jgi:hypothetical protein